MATHVPGAPPPTASPFHSQNKRPPTTSSTRVKLNRRWSLDNLSSDACDTKEGYVKDLRKQHLASLSSIKDEEYPCMLTELAKEGQTGSLSPQSGSSTPKHGAFISPKVNVSRMILGQRTRSGSVELGSFSKTNYRHRAVSKNPFSSSVDISVVPEDNEISLEPHPPSPSSPLRSHARAVGTLRCNSPPKGSLETKNGKTFLRQRSSSLPRILPPILDDDAESLLVDSDRLQTERQSTIVAREMQKFVCRQATDVSTLLPLPLLTNWRQSKSLSRQELAPTSTFKVSSTRSLPGHSAPSSAADLKKQYLLLITSLAKIHGIFFSIRQATPNLFQDFVPTLRITEPMELDPSQLAAIVDNLKIEGILPPDGEPLLRKQILSMTSVSALPFCVITHGGLLDLKNTNFKADGLTRKPSAMKLPGFNPYSCIGSPLLDIFAVLVGCLACDQLMEEEDLALTDLVRGFLQDYHSTLTRTIYFLRCNTFNLTLKELCHDIRTYLTCGVVVTFLNRPPDTTVPSPDLRKRIIKVLHTLRPSVEALTN